LNADVAIYRLGVSILKFNEAKIRQREGMETLLPFLQKMGSRSRLDSIADHNVILSYAHSLGELSLLFFFFFFFFSS